MRYDGDCKESKIERVKRLMYQTYRKEMEPVFGPLTEKEVYELRDLRKKMGKVISWKKVYNKRRQQITVPDYIEYPPWEDIKKAYDEFEPKE